MDIIFSNGKHHDKKNKVFWINHRFFIAINLYDNYLNRFMAQFAKILIPTQRPHKQYPKNNYEYFS